ncbi:hypothetical protein [Klebsiella michiganensis]|uniref:hypothetical protein n=1 Tax=Klebsiella michiganensis TaxID=1134687 RepID=UPI001F151EF3
MKAYYILGHNVAWLNGICLILFVIGVVGAMAMVATIHSFSMDELEAGRHWKDDCRTLEVNMPTGAFTSPVNKLDCDGIIINVPGGQYYSYIHQWELYKANSK